MTDPLVYAGVFILAFGLSFAAVLTLRSYLRRPDRPRIFGDLPEPLWVYAVRIALGVLALVAATLLLTGGIIWLTEATGATSCPTEEVPR